MADVLAQRTKTASTIADDAPVNGDATERQRQRAPTTPTRFRTSGRRGTQSLKKLVFYDPVAFRYLEEDDSTVVVAKRERLQGYELYIVEQWACSRVHPTFAITTYTGDPSHSILVNVLAVPNDQRNWSKRLKVYLDAVSQFHAREQETPLGSLMVTNLSAFPSALTVISVPDGDVRKHREDFIVNENLKRMGCSGRAAMNLQSAAQSTVAKFHHLYQTSESNPFKTAVMELVKVCQTALVLYGKLNDIYADGLLCDITERAINDWWNDIGTDFHNIEPSDGILGPTTVSALVGLMIGAYNRIRSTGVNVPKDVLEVDSMKRAVGHFQKGCKMNKTRRLDRETLDRLHRVTAKTANSEGWAVPRAVKSTVAELSGKGGEMVMGVIGGNKERVAISEVETLDIDKLAQLVPGAKMRWLWQGKPLKSNRADAFGMSGDDGLNGRVFSTDEQGNFLWTSGHRDSVFGGQDGEEGHQHDRSGLGRLRGAVLRSHNTRTSRRTDDELDKDDMISEQHSAGVPKDQSRPVEHMLSTSSSYYGRSSMDKQRSDRPAFGLALADADAHAPGSPFSERAQSKSHSALELNDDYDRASHKAQLHAPSKPSRELSGRRRVRAELRHLHKAFQADVYQKFATEFEERLPDVPILRRSKSTLRLQDVEPTAAAGLRLPRRLSFSLVEPWVLKFPSIQDDMEREAESHPQREQTLSKQMLGYEVQARELRYLAVQMMRLEHIFMSSAETEVVKLEKLDQDTRENLTDLNNAYYQRLDEYQSLQATSRDLMARERASLNDGLKRIDMLSQKLDYELDALDSRMQEVEDGAAEFERNVAEIEARVSELVHDGHNPVSRQDEQVEREAAPWFQRIVNLFVPSR